MIACNCPLLDQIEHRTTCPNYTIKKLIDEVIIPMAEIIRHIDADSEALFYDKIDEIISSANDLVR